MSGMIMQEKDIFSSLLGGKIQKINQTMPTMCGSFTLHHDRYKIVHETITMEKELKNQLMRQQI